MWSRESENVTSLILHILYILQGRLESVSRRLQFSRAGSSVILGTQDSSLRNSAIKNRILGVGSSCTRGTVRIEGISFSSCFRHSSSRGTITRISLAAATSWFTTY